MASLLHTRKKLKSNDEVIAETEADFDEKEKPYYKSSIENLENRDTRCITLEGNYVEQWNWVLSKFCFFLTYSTDLLNDLLLVLQGFV